MQYEIILNPAEGTELAIVFMPVVSLIGGLFDKQFLQKKLFDHFGFWHGERHPRVKEIEIAFLMYVIYDIPVMYRFVQNCRRRS